MRSWVKWTEVLRFMSSVFARNICFMTKGVSILVNPSTYIRMPKVVEMTELHQLVNAKICLHNLAVSAPPGLALVPTCK